MPFMYALASGLRSEQPVLFVPRAGTQLPNQSMTRKSGRPVFLLTALLFAPLSQPVASFEALCGSELSSVRR